ncbi:hypothetical protein BU15DRAFT_55768 [Melanogaster broomeanus]|nr:hypothetical protein BU15DRAFT_55768 [Melanogaster broomeanus]
MTPQATIREHAAKLLGRPKHDSPFINVPTKEEVLSYQKDRGSCCTADALRLDFTGATSSDWNTSAAHVFTESFRKAHPQCKSAQEQIACAAAGHAPQLTIDPILEKRRSHRRKERRAQLYIRRLHTAQLYCGQIPDALRIVEELGLAGISSDESDHEPGHGQAAYNIIRKGWRSAEVTRILRTLDSLHLRARYREHWDATPGSWPHLRSMSLKSSSRAAVKGLPRNFYSESFLLSLSPEALCEIGPDEEDMVSLDIPEGTIAWVFCTYLLILHS